MTQANILLTRNGKKCVCVIDGNQTQPGAYPGSLPEILYHFEDWVSDWNEVRINAVFLYEINFDNHTVRGWQHVSKDWSEYTIQTALKKSVSRLIWSWLPEGWKLNRDKSPVRFNDYGIGEDGNVCESVQNPAP